MTPAPPWGWGRAGRRSRSAPWWRRAAWQSQTWAQCEGRRPGPRVPLGLASGWAELGEGQEQGWGVKRFPMLSVIGTEPPPLCPLVPIPIEEGAGPWLLWEEGQNAV